MNKSNAPYIKMNGNSKSSSDNLSTGIFDECMKKCTNVGTSGKMSINFYNAYKEDLNKEGKVALSYVFDFDTNDLIKDGINNLGLYNSKRPVIKNKKGNIITQDLNLLYYYHNRLVGYQLEEIFK